MSKDKPVIFVIDDDLPVLRSILNTLEDVNAYNVFGFADPKTLIKHELLKAVDLFIIDVTLKEENGRELFNRLCEAGIDTPALFISGLIDDRSFGKLDCDGIYDFMPKPFPSAKIFINRVNLLLKVSEQHKSAISEQERLNSLFEAVLEQAPFGIDVIEKNGHWRVVKSSNMSKEITGDPNLENITDLSYDECNFMVYTLDGVEMDPKELPGVRSFLKGEIIDNDELLVVREDGTEVYVAFKSVPVKNSDDEIIAGLQISYDITEQKKLEYIKLAEQASLRTEFEKRLKVWKADIKSTKTSTKYSLRELNKQTKKLEESRSV